MRIILSPTKKMKTEDIFDVKLTTPVFLEKTEQLKNYLQTLSFDQLKNLFQCNDQIAKLNFERFATMDLKNAMSPAILSYDGIAFQYMAPQIFTQDYFNYVSEHLRILSAFYGVLKPFDQVVSYRLEMQAKLNAPFAKNMYDFWGKDLYDEVVDESHIILNLASKEYSKCIKKYLKKDDLWIDVVFGEWIKGKVVEKGVYVKMARGEMVRYLAEHHIEDVKEISQFDRLGFKYRQDLSSDNQYVFIKEEDHHGESL